jgi:hypothetical protein
MNEETKQFKPQEAAEVANKIELALTRIEKELS